MGVDRHFSHTLSTKFYKTKQKGKKERSRVQCFKKEEKEKKKDIRNLETQLLHISGSNVNGV